MLNLTPVLRRLDDLAEKLDKIIFILSKAQQNGHVFTWSPADENTTATLPPEPQE
jgi:hypothetical protein